MILAHYVYPFSSFVTLEVLGIKKITLHQVIRPEIVLIEVLEHQGCDLNILEDKEQIIETILSLGNVTIARKVGIT